MKRAWQLRSVFKCSLLVCWALLPVAPIAGQTQSQKPPPEQTDVVRVNTELVQTDVMVFDQKGRFVDGLKPEQLSLSIDKKPTAISFF